MPPGRGVGAQVEDGRVDASTTEVIEVPAMAGDPAHESAAGPRVITTALAAAGWRPPVSTVDVPPFAGSPRDASGTVNRLVAAAVRSTVRAGRQPMVLAGSCDVAPGVVAGLAVTAHKAATRLGPTRFTARGLDDRAGTTALILAAHRINPSSLKRKVILAWSVREETGLEGAIALAKRYGSSVKRVFSVDTFVSSDSPLETSRFAHAPLGQGAVIRALDNASVTPPAEIDRILKIARSENIPLQVGATNGGTDGSAFVRYGVLHAGLSWPGRYSHSPVEVLDLRDLQALERLVYALATAP